MLSYCTPYLLSGAHNKKECPTTDGRDGFVGQKGEPGPLGPPGLAGVRVAGPPCPQGERSPPGSQIEGALYTRWGRTCPSTKGPQPKANPAQGQQGLKPTRPKANLAKTNKVQSHPSKTQPAVLDQVKIPYSN